MMLGRVLDGGSGNWDRWWKNERLLNLVFDETVYEVQIIALENGRKVVHGTGKLFEMRPIGIVGEGCRLVHEAKGVGPTAQM
jgi:hypothetical protein